MIVLPTESVARLIAKDRPRWRDQLIIDKKGTIHLLVWDHQCHFIASQNVYVHLPVV
jgi:hypothetical protein